MTDDLTEFLKEEAAKDPLFKDDLAAAERRHTQAQLADLRELVAGVLQEVRALKALYFVGNDGLTDVERADALAEFERGVGRTPQRWVREDREKALAGCTCGCHKHGWAVRCQRCACPSAWHQTSV